MHLSLIVSLLVTKWQSDKQKT